MAYISTFVLGLLGWLWASFGLFVFIMRRGAEYAKQRNESFDEDNPTFGLSLALSATVAIILGLAFAWVGHSIFVWLDWLDRPQ